MKKVKMFLIIIISIFLLCQITLWIGRNRNRIELQNHIQDTTTPLSSQTIEYLCTTFKLSAEDKLCNGEVDVYGPDFYPVIGETFYPIARDGDISTNPANYDYVEQTIGRFKTNCEPISGKDGEKKFDCSYDLKGDEAFILYIAFNYPSMKIWTIYTPMGMD
jgi:hypothetical protein